MNEALNSGAVDVIGLARPLCTEASRSGFCTKHQGTFCNAKPYLRGVGFKGSWSLVLREPTAKEKTLTRVTRTVGTKQQNPRRAHQNPLCVCVSVSISPTVSPSLFVCLTCTVYAYIYSSDDLSLHLSTYLSTCLAISRSISLATCLPLYASFC